jgi:hypothetical protein
MELYERNGIHISAVCLQETWLSRDHDTQMLALENYNFISKARHSSMHGGVAIYLHKSFSYNILPIHSTDLWDGIFLEIFVNNSYNSCIIKKRIVLGNIYRPPKQNLEYIETFITETAQVFENIQQSSNVLIAGDFNLDLLKFKESSIINSYLEHLLSYSYIPTISFPTRLTQRHGTLIDNFFVKISDNFSRTTSGIILNHISDHLPYFICLDYLNVAKDSSKFIKVQTQNSIGFKEYLRNVNILDSLDSNCKTDPNDNYNILGNILKVGMEKFFSSKTVKFNKYRHKKNPWVTQGILIAIRNRDAMYARLKSTAMSCPSYVTNKINLQTYNRILKSSIRTAKRQYFFKSFNKFRNDMKGTWAMIKEVINKSNKTDSSKTFLVDGLTLKDPKLIADHFNKFFSNIGPTLARNIITPSNRSYKEFLTQETRFSFKFNQVSTEHVLKVIDGLKPKSSSGVDSISNKLLRNIKEELSEPLTLIFNQCISNNTFPDALKIAKVTPLHKKNDKNIFDNYRPVSVLTSISKVFEKLLHSQIYDYFNNNGLLYISQYGFRKLHSTDLAALEFIDRVIMDLDKGETPISIFLDLSKAFDTIDHEILIDKFKMYGFDTNSVNLVKSYLSGRQQYVTYENVSSDYAYIATGVPQGSVLGPLFFIIYINDICKASSLFKPVIYADDTSLTATLNTFRSENLGTQDMINRELYNICDWMKLNKLSLNCNKTKAMLFRMPQKQLEYPILNIDGVSIEFVSEFNFLGVIIDECISWKNHINLVAKKISKTIGILNKLKHFFPLNILLNIYNALILPYLNYGALLWHRCSNRLLVLQKRALRVISCSKYNAHTSSLFKNLGLLRCTDICTIQCYKFCYKLEKRLLPDYFSGIFVKQSAIHSHSTRGHDKYTLPSIKHEFARNSIRYFATTAFNNMNEDIKSKIFLYTMNGFKQYVKRFLLNQYDTVCNIPNCFSCQR